MKPQRSNCASDSRCQTIALSLAIIASLSASDAAHAALESGIYHTVPGATVYEYGDYVPGGSRTAPRSATITLDLTGAQASMHAVIYDVEIEGGSAYGDDRLAMVGAVQPLDLTVLSTNGAQQADGSYRFSGDYLGTLFSPDPSFFYYNWEFSATPDGTVLWNGTTSWGGGHIWVENIDNIALVPEPGVLSLIGAGMAVLWLSRKH